MAYNPNSRASRMKNIEIQDVHQNISNEIIEITPEKLEIILRDYLDNITDTNAWQAPLGILVTIILVLLTTDFKEFILPAATWFAIFIICAILSGCWLCKCLLQCTKKITITEIMNKVKNKS